MGEWRVDKSMGNARRGEGRKREEGSRGENMVRV